MGRFYLTFDAGQMPSSRRPPGLVCSSAWVVVLQSDDALTWSEAFTFSVPGRDTRDPHFLVFGGSLFVYTGTWLLHEEGVPLNLNEHLGYAAWTADGSGWNGPAQMEGTYGHYIWRAAYPTGTARSCAGAGAAATGPASRRSSSPGRSSRRCSRAPTAWCGPSTRSSPGISAMRPRSCSRRTAPRWPWFATATKKRARVCRSAPPWKAWTSAYLQRNVGGPLLTRWGGHYLVGGRKSMGDTAATCLWWLHGDALHEAVELPSAGDSSYPGFVAGWRGPGAAVLLLEPRRKHRRLPRRADAGLVSGIEGEQQRSDPRRCSRQRGRTWSFHSRGIAGDETGGRLGAGPASGSRISGPQSWRAARLLRNAARYASARRRPGRGRRRPDQTGGLSPSKTRRIDAVILPAASWRSAQWAGTPSFQGAGSASGSGVR